MSNLDIIFRDVQAHFEYTPDIQAWGHAEYWATPKEDAVQAGVDGIVRGDCDDFAILCRDKLTAQEIGSHLVFCQVETGEYHLVCEVGGYIFDCRQRSVMPRDLLPYTWISISGTSHGDPWHLIVD